MFSGVLLSMFLSCPQFKNNCKTFFCGGCTFFSCINMCTFFYFVLLSVSYIHFVTFRLREIFALFFTYSIDTDSISVILCNKYNALHRCFYYQRKIYCQMFSIRSWFVLLFAFCSPFDPRRGPQGGLPYMYMYTTTHEVFSFAYFSVYNEQHTTIIMQLGTL